MNEWLNSIEYNWNPFLFKSDTNQLINNILNINRKSNCFLTTSKEKFSLIESIKNDFNTILAMVNKKDPETRWHLQRLSLLSWLLSEKVGKNKKFVENMYFVAPLHDIWKISIPDSILLKEWELNEDEFKIMKTHTIEWDKLLANLEKRYWKQDIISFARDITLYHHEKYDWSGYPEWLSWKWIPIEARILAITDLFDALKSKRPYKEVFSDKKTIKIIKEWRWTHFDPHIVDVFLENWDELLEIRDIN